MKSLIKEVGEILFADFKKINIYMMPFELSKNIELSAEYNFLKNTISNIVEMSPVKKGTAYLTVDFKNIQAGNTHRRGGPHTDGNFIYGWGGDGGGNGWLTGSNGRLLSPEKHRNQYLSELGGALIVSDFEACRAWLGEYEDTPSQGGNCSHVDLSRLNQITLKKNKVYLMNSTCIHESMPIHKNINRKLIRITLPATEEVFK